jgi:glycolate oxidase FAD binding subunit
MRSVQTHHEALASHLGPGLIATGGASLVITPRNAVDASRALQYADAHRLPVRIEGSGTKSAWGNPVSYGMILSTVALHGLREHVWQDLTATVGAGTPWAQLQAALAAHGQTVALDPLCADTATVGGIIATNDSGSLRTRYGSLRDLIIGMTVVLADGTVAKTGGKVVKNVAGYDLHKLMTGAFGTLGLITEVTFRLHPVPRSHATWTIASTDILALDRARHALADSTLPLEALQLRSTDAGFALDVKLVFTADRLDHVAQQIRALVSPLEISSASDAVWSVREGLFHPEKVTAKVTLTATSLASFTDAVRAAGGRSVAQQSGILTASLPAHPALLISLRKQAEAAGGSLTILSWPASTAGKPGTWGNAGDALPLMREIKRRFDPNGILNPGRFLAEVEGTERTGEHEA